MQHVEAAPNEPPQIELDDTEVVTLPPLPAPELAAQAFAPPEPPAPPGPPAPAADDFDDPPFDPPDEDDEILRGNPFSHLLVEEEDDACEEARTRWGEGRRKPPTLTPTDEHEPPAPAIAIHVSWTRTEIAELITKAGADRRLARAEISYERGDIEGAAARFAMLDTTLTGADLLAAVDRLMRALNKDTKILIFGAVNDVRLYRDLAQRGVCDYLVPPVAEDDLVRLLCALYAEKDTARTIAVIGARGGVGASTLAQNIAWSITERHRVGAALVDLDIPFGTSAFNFGPMARQSITDILQAPDSADEALAAHAAATGRKRLRVLTAPATLERGSDLDLEALDTALKSVRRTSPFVVLDLPHAWNGWVKRALTAADEVLIVAGPDLASLRNAKNMVDQLTPARATAPHVALAMVGARKQQEISLKDFSDTVGGPPIATFGFDPALFGEAAIKGQMIGEIAPRSRAAAAIDALTCALTGLTPSPEEAPEREAPAIAEEGAPAAIAASPPAEPVQLELPLGPPAPKPPVLDLVLHAPPPEAPYIVRARGAAQTSFRPKPARRRKRQSGARGVSVAARVLGGIAALSLVACAFRAAEPQAPAAPRAHAALPAAPRTTPADSYGQALAKIGASDFAAAAPLLRSAAERGFAPAQYRLAKLYERGQGLGADLTMARIWTERAAEAGNCAAMHDLGVYYARGEGAPADLAAAYRWFRQAAEFGVAESQFNLGILYHEGRGVAADMNEAAFWFLVAAKAGYAPAQARASEIEARLSPEDIARVHARADAFRARTPNAAANGV